MYKKNYNYYIEYIHYNIVCINIILSTTLYCIEYNNNVYKKLQVLY